MYSKAICAISSSEPIDSARCCGDHKPGAVAEGKAAEAGALIAHLRLVENRDAWTRPALRPQREAIERNTRDSWTLLL
jgi:hypothetical protein